MKSLILLFLFVGMFVITHGVYEHKLKSISKQTKIEYRFVPRSYYDEQLAEASTSLHFKDMFQKDSWMDRLVGSFAPSQSETQNAKIVN